MKYIFQRLIGLLVVSAVCISQAAEPEFQKNYISNGGAERGWYGTAGLSEDAARWHDSGKIEITSRNHFDCLMERAIDDTVSHSGTSSFKLFTPVGAYRDNTFFMTPVPFRKNEKVCMTFWAKADRNTSVEVGLFCANGIAYTARRPVTTEWTKMRLYIPSWGKVGEDVQLYGDPSNGYAGGIPYCMPSFAAPTGATIWIDDICYSLETDDCDFTPVAFATNAVLVNCDKTIYRPGMPIETCLTVRNLSSDAATFLVRRKLLDWRGNVVDGSIFTTEFVLEANESKNIQQDISIPENLRGAMNVVFETSMNGEQTETSGVYFGVLDEPGPLQHRLGLNMSEGNAEMTLEFLKEFRVGTVRLWEDFRDWHLTVGFRHCKLYHDAGIYNLIVTGTPATVAGKSLPRNECMLPVDPSDWLAQQAELIDAHKGEIQVYEFLNEINIWQGRLKNPDPVIFEEPTPENYVRHLGLFHDMLAEHDPDALVGGPTTCRTDLPFIQHVLSLGADKYLDLITEHSYRPLPENPDYADDLRGLYGIIKKHGIAKHAQTECGNSNLPHLPDELIDAASRRRAAKDTRNMIIAWAAGADHYSHFMMSVIRCGIDWTVTMLGNGNNHYQPKPTVALYAFRAAADNIDSGKFVKEVKIGKSYRCYIFDKGNSRVAAIWKWEGDPCAWTVTDELAASSQWHDFLNIALPVPPGELDDYPCYISTEKSADWLAEEIGKCDIATPAQLCSYEVLPVDARNYNVIVINNGANSIDGTISCGGQIQTIEGLLPMEKATFTFQSASNIGMAAQMVPMVIDIPGKKWKLEENLELGALLVNKVNAPLKIDGDISDWPDSAEFYPMTLFKAGMPQVDVSAQVALAWDDSFLYVAVVADKADHYPSDSPLGLWKGDCVQIGLDTLRNATKFLEGYQDDDFEYDFALIGEKTCVCRSRASLATYDSLGKKLGAIDEVPAAVVRGINQTIYEIALPKAGVSPFQLKENSAMRFDVLLNIANEKGRIGYLQFANGLGNNPKLPGQFINIILK